MSEPGAGECSVKQPPVPAVHGRNTPKYRAVQRLFSSLVVSLQHELAVLGAMLFEKRLISLACLIKARDTNQDSFDRSSALMTSILSKIEINQRWYDKFLSVLSSIGEPHLVDELKKALSEEEAALKTVLNKEEGTSAKTALSEEEAASKTAQEGTSTKTALSEEEDAPLVLTSCPWKRRRQDSSSSELADDRVMDSEEPIHSTRKKMKILKYQFESLTANREKLDREKAVMMMKIKHLERQYSEAKEGKDAKKAELCALRKDYEELESREERARQDLKLAGAKLDTAYREFKVFQSAASSGSELVVMHTRQTVLSASVQENLQVDPKYPGITFYSAPVIRHQTETKYSFTCMGTSLHISKSSPNAEVSICPCFTGPFELPDEYRSASPAYLVCHDNIRSQKDVTLTMHHYAHLQNEEDCEDMAFLSASSTPVYRDSHPVYIFKEMCEVVEIFKPGDQVGEVSLRHFSFVKAARRKRTRKKSFASSPKKHQGGDWYSARLYRSLHHDGVVSAVFCMCLCDRMYIEHCDSIMRKEFRGILSQVLAHDIQELVDVFSNDDHVIFDRTPAQTDIDIPETMDADVAGYPPRLLISAQTSSEFSSPKIYVRGLDRECGFNLHMPVSIQQSSLEHETIPTTLTHVTNEASASPVIQQPSLEAVATTQTCATNETSASPATGVDVPTLREFICFPMASGKVNLAQRISRYNNFGILLLKDDNGDRTKAIVRELRDCPEDINMEIFRSWLKGGGLRPVSWDTVVGVMQDIGLKVLK